MFAELLAKSNCSFLEGASHPEEMVAQAKSLSYAALGIVDRSGVYGAPRAHVAAKQLGLKLIVGAEVRLTEYQIAYFLCQNRIGYGNLCELISQAHQGLVKKIESTDGPVLLSPDYLNKSAGLFLILPTFGIDETLIPLLKQSFGERLYFAVSRFFDENHQSAFRNAISLSERYGVHCIATNQPLFHRSEQKPLQDVLTCIRYTKTLRNAGFHLLSNGQRYLKSMGEIVELFKDHPDWLRNTLKIADACNFSLDEIQYEYPHEWLPPGETGSTYLRRLVVQGLGVRYPTGPPAAVQKQVDYELKLIDELRYADYFLTIWDIVQYAKSKKILCQGRGSAANSVVCFVLGITAIDPVRMDLLFERFISRERNEPPDIDIDFEHERREEVIQYIYNRYGRHRAAITAEVICFRRKSALREVAKVFEIPLPAVEKILSLTHRESLSDVDPRIFEELSIEPAWFQLFWELTQKILNFPRHLGTHVGGFVLCQEALNRNIPIEKAAMEGRTIVQWDKNDLDALGFVRVDILGLGILTCIRKSFEFLKAQNIDLTLATIPAEDPRVYEAVGRGDTVGVFQIESRAQMNMLPRLKPRNFFDLVVEISIVRPGPIQGEMVHPYLLRRAGKEKVEYASPELEAILKKTYGVPLFQEQIMKMAMTVAGFSGGEADQLRRAMGTWRKHGTLFEMGDRFRQGLIQRGIAEEFANRIFKQIEGFAEYGFPESHAASFAILAYATAYLKVYHPEIFLAALLNSQPMGFYSSQSLIYDAGRHGVKVLPIDINFSTWDNQIENGAVRLGFREIKGFPERTGRAIEKCGERCQSPPQIKFSSFGEFVHLLKQELNSIALTKRELFLLAGASAFDSIGFERRQAFWEIQGLNLVDSHYLSAGDVPVTLPKESAWEGVCLDFESQGVSLKNHPMAFLRPELKGVMSSQALRFLPAKKRVQVAGIVICRQMPMTASGVLFVSLEDEFGFINLVVWNNIYQKFKEIWVRESFLLCEGIVEKAQEDKRVIHVIAERVTPLMPHNRQYKSASHDFR